MHQLAPTFDARRSFNPLDVCQALGVGAFNSGKEVKPVATKTTSRSSSVKVESDDVSARLAVLEHVGNNVSDELDKHADSMTKLTEISSRLEQVLAVQSERLEQQGKNILQFDSSIKDLITALDKNTDRQITTLSQEMRAMNESHAKALSERDVDRMGIKQKVETEIATVTDNQIKMFGDVSIKIDTLSTDLTTRLYKIERWRWIVVGAIAILVTIIKMLDPHMVAQLFM